MSERYALIVDADDAFRARLEAILTPAGYEILVATDEAEMLDLFTRHKPSAVFIAVDLPDKAGFVLFSKIKKLRRVAPVFLATATVSRADLKLHEKLKVHAEAYWDKREVADEEIVETLVAKIGFEAEPTETRYDAPHAPAENVSAMGSSPRETAPDEESESRADAHEISSNHGAPRHEPEPWLSELLDPETASVLAEIDEEGLEALLPARPASSDPDGAPSPELVAELEEEIARVREELEQARRDARSSPFSAEFASLRESASKNDKVVRSLKATLSRREGQIAIVKKKLIELARRVLEGQRLHETASEKHAELKAAFEALRGRFDRLQKDSEEQQKGFERDRSLLKESLAAERAALSENRRAHEAELAELRSTFEEAFREEEVRRAEKARELEARHDEDRAKLAEELKAKYADRARELQDSHAAAQQSLRDQHRIELETLHRQHREASEKNALEARETLRQQSEQSAALLQRANQHRLSELERAENKRRAELDEAKKQHEGELDELRRAHQAELDRLQQENATTRNAAENVHAEYTAKLADLVTSLEEERNRHQETRERYEREVAEAQTTHAKSLEQAEQDQFSALATMSRKFREERSRLIDNERNRAEERVEQLQREHKEAIDGLVARHAEELALLRTSHHNELERRASDQEQQVRRGIEAVRTELKEQSDRAARAHADELAELRQEHENETAALRAAHMEALAERDRETQAALRDAVEKAKVDQAERLSQAKKVAAAAEASIRKEYESEIAALEQAHRDAIAKRDRDASETLRNVSTERDEAKALAEKLKVELAELQSRLRDELTAADEKHLSELLALKKETRQQLSQLEDEKEFLASSVEKLKRQSHSELTKTLDGLAHEKKLHQATKDRYERRIAELKANHSDAVKSLESDWMQTLHGLEQSLVGRTGDQTAKVEAEWKDKLAREQEKHEQAVKALTNDFTMEIATLRRQLDRTRAMEDSYQAGAQEITSLKAKIDALTEEVTEVRMALAEREHELELSQKKLSETTGSIESLKAVIEDFSRSVKGFDQERQESDETIDSLKAVIDDFYRSLHGSEPKN